MKLESLRCLYRVYIVPDVDSGAVDSLIKLLESSSSPSEASRAIASSTWDAKAAAFRMTDDRGVKGLLLKSLPRLFLADRKPDSKDEGDVGELGMSALVPLCRAYPIAV